jgi:hypothetical protein
LSRGRLVLRAAVIGLLFAQQLLRWAAGWLWLVATFAGRERRKAWFGQVVADLFRSLGATFIKVGQIMSTRPDLIPDHVTRALERLQDDVGPFPFAAVATDHRGGPGPSLPRAVHRAGAGADRVCVGGPGPQGPSARRAGGGGEGAPAGRGRAVHLRPGGDAPGARLIGKIPTLARWSPRRW